MTRTRIVGVSLAIVAGAAAAGCSGGSGSKSSGSGRPTACVFIAKLDSIANTVASADVRDPDAFRTTLNAAVHDYVSNVRSLRAVAPDNLRAGLLRVEADVQQLRFDAALTDRAELDAYAARECGRVSSTTTSTSGPATGATVTAPETASTVIDGASTTVASGG